MITVENLSMDFTGKAGSAKALSDVSFAISAGEILGIVGKSGAGKTTLLRLLSFQMRPNSGRILIEGEPVDHTTSARALRRIVQQSATVFQGFSLLYNRNVVENVALPLKLRGMSRSQREEKARDLLNFVGLAHRARAYPITLSGGEAQRVAIARALVTDPKILFLDEPTSALDSQTSKDILDLVKRTHQTYGVTIVLVSHQIEVVRYMCDRVLHLEQGRIKRLGPIQKAPEFHVETMEQIWGMPDV